MEGGPLPLQRVSPPYYLNPLLSRIALRLGTVTVMSFPREIQVCISLIAFGALPRMSLAGHSLSLGGETLVSDIQQERQPLGLNSPTLTPLSTSVLLECWFLTLCWREKDYKVISNWFRYSGTK